MWSFLSGLTTASGDGKEESSSAASAIATTALSEETPASDAEPPKTAATDEESPVEKKSAKKQPKKTIKAVPVGGAKVERPTQDVARDTKRILEICYGNGSTSNDGEPNTITTTNSTENENGETAVEVKHIELNPKPRKKKKTGAKKKKIVKKKKPPSTATATDGKGSAATATATTNEDGTITTTKKRKKKKRLSTQTITTTETLEDGTVVTITKKKKRRRKKKKKKPPIKRDAAGRIIRKRLKIKNRHRVVKKELIRNGKDAKIDLPTIEEGQSSEEESNSESSGSDSDYYEDSTMGDSSYSDFTDITGSSTLESDGELDDDDDDDGYAVCENSDEEEDSDEEESDDMMIVYEEDELQYDEEENELEDIYEVDDFDEILESNDKDVNGDGDTVGTASTSGSQSAYLGASAETSQMDIEAQSVMQAPNEIIRSDGADSGQPKDDDAEGSNRSIAIGDAESIGETRKGILNETEVFVFQAEDAFLLDGTSLESGNDTSTTGFCREGYATDFTGEMSSAVFFPVILNETGFYRVAIRYANGGDEDVPLQLFIDNKPVGEFALIPTGNWSTWMVEGVDDILLREGDNHTIDLWTSDERDVGPNVDWLSVRFVDSATRFEFLTTILSPLTNVTTPNQNQISALLLQNLTTLMLNANFLSGSIPEEIASSMEGLRILDLGANNLVGDIPETIFAQDSLEFLVLASNGLDGPLSSNVGRLRKLEMLDLQNNQLSETLPTQLGFLTKLDFLILGFNEFTGSIPSELGQLTDLSLLDLSKLLLCQFARSLNSTID
ncbi:MAG: hypothetical protein SGILL_001969 [Bacillariaceae sp.]